jgi:hypothetical protein
MKSGTVVKVSASLYLEKYEVTILLHVHGVVFKYCYLENYRIGLLRKKGGLVGFHYKI